MSRLVRERAVDCAQHAAKPTSCHDLYAPCELAMQLTKLCAACDGPGRFLGAFFLGRADLGPRLAQSTGQWSVGH